MKNGSTLALAAIVLLTMTVQIGFAADPAQLPALPQSAASANLIVRAERALREYVAACSTGDGEAFARIVTSDALIEYALEAPGTYLESEAALMSANGSNPATPSRQEQKSTFRQTVDFPNERFEHGIRSLQNKLRRSIAGPGVRTPNI